MTEYLAFYSQACHGCCNQLEKLGFSLWMCQPRLGFKELLDVEDSIGVTRWEQEG